MNLKDAGRPLERQYKTAKFVIKDVQFGKGGFYDVVGDLTIKGKTHPISFRADVSAKWRTRAV